MSDHERSARRGGRYVVDPDPIGTAVGGCRTPKLTDHEIGYMLAVCARLPNIFAAAKERLGADLFDQNEAKYVLVWRAVIAAAEAAGGILPTNPEVAKELVAVRCSSEIASDPTQSYYTTAVERAVLDNNGLLDIIFALPVSEELEKTGFDLLVRFIGERKIADPLRRALAGLGTRDTLNKPDQIISLLDAHARDVAGIGADPGADAVPDDDFDPPAVTLIPTGMRWLDAAMGGGQARKETYVVLGGTGSGKSALGVQIALEGADLWSALAGDVGPTEVGVWFYFTYELTRDQIRERFNAYGARIHHESFTSLNRDPKTNRLMLSTAADPSSLKPYEYDPFVNSPGNPTLGERERLDGLKKRVGGRNSRLIVVDYSGTYPGTGIGGVTEIATYLRRYTDSRRRQVAGVIIDYAGLAVQREIGGKGYKPDAEYNLLASFVDKVRNQVSIPFDCPAWVFHQLHGDSTRRAAGAKIHHSEARGCRNFADNCDFAHCMTPYSKSTGMLNVWTTKHRRAPGREDGTIVRFDGRFGAFRDPDQEYTVDPQTRQIVPRGYMDQLPGGSAGSIGYVDPRID